MTPFDTRTAILSAIATFSGNATLEELIGYATTHYPSLYTETEIRETVFRLAASGELKSVTCFRTRTSHPVISNETQLDLFPVPAA